jgi:hypothetical protein
VARPDLGSWRVRAGAVVVLCVAVAALLVSVNRPTWEPRPIVAVDGERSEAELTVTVAHDRCRSKPRVRVEESDAQVRLRAEQDVTGDCESIGLESTFVVELVESLGRRGLVVEEVPGDRPPVRCTTGDHGGVRCR